MASSWTARRMLIEDAEPAGGIRRGVRELELDADADLTLLGSDLVAARSTRACTSAAATGRMQPGADRHDDGEQDARSSATQATAAHHARPSTRDEQPRRRALRRRRLPGRHRRLDLGAVRLEQRGIAARAAAPVGQQAAIGDGGRGLVEQPVGDDRQPGQAAAELVTIERPPSAAPSSASGGRHRSARTSRTGSRSWRAASGA